MTQSLPLEYNNDINFWEEYHQPKGAAKNQVRIIKGDSEYFMDLDDFEHHVNLGRVNPFIFKDRVMMLTNEELDRLIELDTQLKNNHNE